MTTPTTDVVPAGAYDNTGLEDLTSADLVVPRLRIKHKDGVFEDSGSNEQFPEIFCVILGLVRQRVLFHHNVEDGDMPMCKSPDFNIGYPNLNPVKTPKLNFPWAKAGFDPANFPIDHNGNRPLPCEGCALKDWGSHPLGEKPYCAEQFTLPIYYASTLEQLMAGEYGSALISFQKTGVPPTKKYLGVFKNKRVPAYTAFTRITLKQQTRGQTEYCVPGFMRVGDTNPTDHLDYSENYAGIRQFLVSTVPMGQVDEDDTVPSTPVAAGRPPLGNPTPAPAAPTIVQPNIPVVEAQLADEDDKLPF